MRSLATQSGLLILKRQQRRDVRRLFVLHLLQTEPGDLLKHLGRQVPRVMRRILGSSDECGEADIALLISEIIHALFRTVAAGRDCFRQQYRSSKRLRTCFSLLVA